MSSLASHLSLAPNVVVLDPDSNLLIISKNPQKSRPFYFHVSSKVLSLASPIFASLFPDSASHSRQYQIILDDDHPEPVGTLLELCHFGRTTPLPPAQLNGINALAEASQKYGISAPMIPWMASWSQQLLHDKDRLEFGKGNELRQWLRVCCVYSQDTLFSKVTKRAILTGNDESLDISESPGAPYNSIIAQIALKRIEVLTDIIEITLTLLNQYQTTESICRQPTNSAQCDAILLGSVLRGLMGLGVYQPTPKAPYPGMTAMALIEKVKSLPLMVDPSHGGTCGEMINKNICRLLRLAHEVLSRVKGLELEDFAADQPVGKPHGLVLSVIEEQHIKGQAQDSGEIFEGKKEREKMGDDIGGEKRAEKLQEVKEVREEGKKVECDGRDENGKDEGESEGLLNILALDNASKGGNVPPASLQVPVGVFAGFLETTETLKDFGPQSLFEDKTASREMSDNGKGKVEYWEGSSTTAMGGRLTKKQGLELKQKHPVNTENQTEQPKPTTRDYIPSKVQGQPPSSSSEKGELTVLQNVHTKHAMARANAEAQGNKWLVPGPVLVQRYQRGPRLPFHPNVTVGDISNKEHTIQIKRLKDQFPQVDTKCLVEFLRQGDWNSQTAMDMLRAGGILAKGTNDDSTLVSGFPILEPIVLSPLPTTHHETGRNSTALPEVSSTAPATKPALASITASKRVISVSRLVAGELSIKQTEARFWPAPDKEVVMRSLALDGNKEAVRKLLAMFPQASADKGIIDVLYRSGWDTEKAARRLEGLGLVREAVCEASGDSGKGKNKKSMGNEVM